MFQPRGVVRDPDLGYRLRMSRLFLWVSVSLLAFGCGLSITAKQTNEPCTRTAECVTGLTCLAGVCMATTDGGTDAGVDAGQ